jgi:hypothetical protein
MAMIPNSKQRSRHGIPILMSGALSLAVGATLFLMFDGSHDEVMREMIS